MLLNGRPAALALAAAALALLAPPPAPAAAQAEPGFFGISPQSETTAEDLALMEQARVTSVRLPLYWMEVEPSRAAVAAPDWSGFDRAVALAAEHGISAFPAVWGSPRWVAGAPKVEPVGGGRLAAWVSFLRAAVLRYGPGGAFWRENPGLPYLPVQLWEVWNEENIVGFDYPNPARYARLLRASGRALHGVDPEAKVLVGGLFGQPVRVPPNVRAADFLARLYRAGVKPFFDGVALHPYAADASEIPAQVRGLRRVMRAHRDGAKPLYVTELGWGSDSFESRWEHGWWGQANQLDRAFAMLAAHRRSWRIGGVWWFTWTDVPEGCLFCDSAGLLTEDREAKPAWYRFNAWTGGDPGGVPRAPRAARSRGGAPPR